VTVGSVLSIGRRAGAGRAGPEIATAPVGIDATSPSVARMYNHYLGGKDNYVVDRDLAERALRTAPIIYGVAQANRAFLHYAAWVLAGQAGIRQFLDIGCGLPAHVNLDDVVRRVDPSCRVAYLDNDPMVLSHARALLAVDGDTGAFEADLREPGALLAHPELRQLIDLGEPVAVFLLEVLPFIADADDPGGIVDELVRGLPAGSHLVISHAERTPELDAVAAIYRDAGISFTPRSRPEIAGFFHELEPVAPPTTDLPPSYSRNDLMIGGAMPLVGHIGRKPGR
jgi:SAM-dependent methyltransferase